MLRASALAKTIAGTAGTQAPDPSLSWFDPFAVDGTSALLWSAAALLGFYLVVGFALQGYAGVGTDGIGLAGEAASGDALSVVGRAAVGSGFATLMELAVMVSAAACLVAAVLPTARSMLSMGVYGALPPAFARVDGRSGSPVVATVAVGIAAAAVLVVLSIVSDNVLGWALVRKGRDTIADDYGLTTLLGLGGVFVIGVATMLIGVGLMVLWNLRAPAFFRGETL